MRGGMMKWMLIGCVLILVMSFLWPVFGITGYTGWLWFGLILLVCFLPMVMMKRRRKNSQRSNNDERG